MTSSQNLYRTRLCTPCDVISDCWNKTQLSKSRSTSSFTIILLSCTLCLPLILVTHISRYQDPPAQPCRISISTVNYRKTIFKHPDLTKIIGVQTKDTLHLLHNEIKSNAIEFHSNLGGFQHVYLGLVVRTTSYALISNTPFVRPIYPGTLIILVVSICHAQDELKHQYDENV